MAHEDLFKATHGKFENKATEIIYEMSLDGGCDEEAGDVDHGGWFGKMRGPFNDEKGNEIPGLGHYNAGAILQITSDGFVYSEFFTSQAKLDKKWKKIEKETEAYGDED
jgi:hypothetical protein